MISASQLELLLVCPGQAVLPSYADSSPAAREGTREHEELLTGLVTGQLPDTPRGRALRHVRLPEGTEMEVAYAVDVENLSARRLELAGPRQYGVVGDSEIVGTIDLVHENDGVVVDLKAGECPVTPPRWNAQLWFFGLALVLLRTVTARLGLLHVTACGERRDVESYQLHQWEAWKFLDRLQALVARVALQRDKLAHGERLDLVVGPHCRYCRAVYTCPALVEQLGDGSPGERHQRALAQLAKAKAMVARTEKHLDADRYELPTGAALVKRVIGRRTLNVARALEVLPDLRSVATEETTLRLNVGDVDAWADANAAGRSKRARRTATTQRLMEAGAIYVAEKETWILEEKP